MSQSKKDSHEEIQVNQVVGIVLGFIAMRIMIPLLRDMDENIQSAIIVFVMFCLSYSRGYTLRRFYNSGYSFEYLLWWLFRLIGRA